MNFSPLTEKYVPRGSTALVKAFWSTKLLAAKYLCKPNNLNNVFGIKVFDCLPQGLNNFVNIYFLRRLDLDFKSVGKGTIEMLI